MKILGLILLLIFISVLGVTCYQLGKQAGRKEEREERDNDRPIKIKSFRELCR